MAVHAPLTRPLPTVLQAVDSVSGKHHSASPVSTDSSVHNSLESWFHVSSSSSHSSFSVHPSLPPLPKGARAPSPQPSPSHLVPHPTRAATLPSPLSPAPSLSGSRQGCLALSWSFEWRGISKIVKWALHSQDDKSPDRTLPPRPPSPRFTEQTAALGIPSDTEALYFVPKKYPGAHTHSVSNDPGPRASFVDHNEYEERYTAHSHSEHGHSTQSYHSSSGMGMTFPSISEVHLPRGWKGGRRPRQPYLQITPRHPQHVRSASTSRHDLNHIARYNESCIQVNSRMAFSDCGHSDNQFGRESWITPGAYSEQDHGATRVSFPSYSQSRHVPPPLPFTSVQDFATSRRSFGNNVPTSSHNSDRCQRTRTVSSRASTATTNSKRKLRKHARTRSATASRTSLITEESLLQSKPLPPTPTIPNENRSPTSEIRPRPRKLTKRKTNGHDSLQSPVRNINEPLGSKITATRMHSPSFARMNHHDASTEEPESGPRMRPSFLRTESNRRWTVAVADVPDELLIEELERLRRLGMRAGEVHGNPSQVDVFSLGNNMHASMSDEYMPMVDSADVSEFNHDTTNHGDEQEWAYARRAMLCCRDLVRTERTYRERLQDLVQKHVSDTVPALALQYLPALIVASDTLNDRFADDPSAYGVSMSFLDTQLMLETAFIAWCGVVGEFFSDEPRRVDHTMNHSRVSQARARKPSVLRRYPGRHPANMPQPRSLSVHDHAIMAWSNASGNNLRGHLSATSEIIGLQLPPIQEPERAAEKTPSTGFARNFNMASIRNKKTPARRSPPFRELAILPTQRVTRYVLLFKDLLKHTPTTSPTRDVVQKALECANSLATKCDRAQGNANFLYNF